MEEIKKLSSLKIDLDIDEIEAAVDIPNMTSISPGKINEVFVSPGQAVAAKNSVKLKSNIIQDKSERSKDEIKELKLKQLNTSNSTSQQPTKLSSPITKRTGFWQSVSKATSKGSKNNENIENSSLVSKSTSLSPSHLTNVFSNPISKSSFLAPKTSLENDTHEATFKCRNFSSNNSATIEHNANPRTSTAKMRKK
jgi:hypothetical protein